ncbi:hypothetical protein GBAR_LOCUS26867 [Geodia barretti]|uniref:Uncharacterized protein n=1 Tax=Geodia barretti TaxID=519541 RepID=A0AA35X7X8_GEOBA|nr:hypothetical protein GBAR_LOCUS26867 [Geodia barretti]
MGIANNGRCNNYNSDGEENNDSGFLNPDAARLLARLISLREFQLLSQVEELGTAPLNSLDWQAMPGVAREYQSSAAGDLKKVDAVDGFDVMASASEDDPTIVFQERRSDPERGGPDEFDDLPFL